MSKRIDHMYVAIDWTADFLARICPALLEIYKDNRPQQLVEIAKACTPEQRQMVLAGAARMARSIEEINAAFTKVSRE